MKGGKHGKAIVPRKGEASLLYKTLKGPVKHGNDEIQAMPKAGPGAEWTPLSDEQIDVIKRWIDEGAKWPTEKKS